MRRDRPYQVEAKLAMSAAYDNPQRKNTVLSLPPSGGKTYTTTSWLIDRSLSEGRRVIWIVHRDELINQAVIDFMRQDEELLRRIEEAATESRTDILLLRSLIDDGDASNTLSMMRDIGWKPTFPITVWKGAAKDATGQIVVASNQSGASLVNWLTSHQEYNDFDVMVIDEAHHAAGATYTRLRNEVKHKFLLGLTGTPKRHDEEDFGFDHICYQVPFPRLFSEGWCARPVYRRCRTKQEHLFSVRMGEFSKKSLRSLNNAPRNEFVADLFFGHRDTKPGVCPCSKDGSQSCFTSWWPGLFFCVDVEHAFELLKVLKAKGRELGIPFNAKIVTGDTDIEVRRDVVSSMRDGRVDALINVEVFTEGTDIPQIRSIQLCRPTASETLWLQMALRGGRSFTQYAATGDNPKPGLDADNHFYLVDYVDSVQHYENVSRGWALRHLDTDQAQAEVETQDEFAKAQITIETAKKSVPEGTVEAALAKFKKRFKNTEYEESGLSVENFILSQVASLLITSSISTDNATRVLSPDEDMAILLAKEFLDRRLDKWTPKEVRKATINTAYRMFGSKAFKAGEWNSIMNAYISHSVYKQATNERGSRHWLHMSGMQSPPMQEVVDRIEEIEEEIAASDKLFEDKKTLWINLVSILETTWPSPCWSALSGYVKSVNWRDKTLSFIYTGGPLTEQAYWLEAAMTVAIREHSGIEDARCHMILERPQTMQPCPECSAGKLVVRDSTRGRFLSCNQWAKTKCRGTKGMVSKDTAFRKMDSLLRQRRPPGR